MYTKGEWKAVYRYPHNVYTTDGKRPPTITPIATMTAPDQAECEANARLIAVAPRMYEALKLYLMGKEGFLNAAKQAIARVEEK